MHAIQQTSFSMKFFDALIMSVVLAFNAVALEVDLRYIVLAFAGSLSGSLVLAYFRRVRGRELLFKVVCSSTGGIVLGAAVQEYFAITNVKYVLFLFFVSSLLSLVVLGAFLSLTENNVTDLFRNFLQRVFNLQLKEEREKRSRKNRNNVEKE